MRKSPAIITTLTALCISTSAWCATPLKIGFIYLDTPSDSGWTHSHNLGKIAVKQSLGDKVTLTSVNNVPEGPQAEGAIQKLVDSGHQLIFTTSFGYMDPTLTIAKKSPAVIFENATGYKRAKNMGTYNIRFYEGRTVLGHIAAKMSKKHVIGYIAPYPIPEVFQGINAAYLAAAKVNPNTKMKVKWVYTWYDPKKETAAAEELIKEGADMIMTHTDSPAPCQTAQKRGVYAFGQGSDMSKFCPKAHLTAIINNWAPYYVRQAKAVLNGTWESKDTWGGFHSGMLKMAPYNTQLMPANLITEAKALQQAMAAGKVNSFSGPIYSQDGQLKVPAGKTATDKELLSMQWYVKGIDDLPPASQ